MFLAVAAGIILLLCLLMMLKVTVQFNVMIENGRPELAIDIFSLFRLVRWRMRFPRSPQNRPLSAEPAGERQALTPVAQPLMGSGVTWQDAREVWRIIRWFLRHVSCSQWKTSTLFGTGQANTTGWLTGFLWALQEQFLFYMSRAWKMAAKPKVVIRPVFHQRLLSCRFECITSFRLGYAILAGMRFLIYWFWKRRWRQQKAFARRQMDLH
ncbi:MAG: hypothetical protein BAA01_02945 [Bacillus thermozeamaize]|uniref:DUF2953 domain-containing protein n=1 Tax=Bacillus thermozeamaize TaxID=230954 RepID=A0A1Y3PRS9_9BACI|nr:MAG: hypothetical protein BAA01_02945 [Bacillus thermozeamaize]